MKLNEFLFWILNDPEGNKAYRDCSFWVIPNRRRFFVNLSRMGIDLYSHNQPDVDGSIVVSDHQNAMYLYWGHIP